MKRRLPVLAGLALCLLLAAPAHGAEAGGKTIYTSDSKSFEAALAEAEDGDTINIASGADVNVTSGTELDPLVIDKRVTITGGALALRPAGILLEADVTFQNMTLTMANNCHDAIFANGYNLTIDGVSCDSRQVDLFGGNLYELSQSGSSVISTPLSQKSGPGGTILVKGSNSGFGNIYAGSMNGSFDRPVTIRLESNLNSGGKTGTVILASGAVEGQYDSNNWFDTNYQPSDPAVNLTACPMTGGAEVEMGYLSGVTVYGATGGSANASVLYFGDHRGYTGTATLKDVGALGLERREDGIKTDLAIAADSTFVSGGAALTVPDNAILNLTSLGETVSAASLSGGGTLFLGQTQTMTITGAVTGTTKVAVGGVSWDGLNSSASVLKGHPYIIAAEAASSAFALLPDGYNTTYVLTPDEDGNWTAGEPGEASPDTTVKVRSASVEATAALPAENSGAELPLTVTYAQRPASRNLSYIPMAVSLNGVEMTLGTFGDSYEYYAAEDDAHSGVYMLFVEQDWDDPERENLVIYGTGSGEALPEGVYAITLTIPGEYMEDGNDETLSVTLTVGAGGSEPDPDPEPDPEPDPVYTPGDVNEDGRVTIADAVLIQRYLLEGMSLSQGQVKAADFDESGAVTAADVIALCRHLAGL